jgi:hypothetical protein
MSRVIHVCSGLEPTKARRTQMNLVLRLQTLKIENDDSVVGLISSISYDCTSTH